MSNRLNAIALVVSCLAVFAAKRVSLRQECDVYSPPPSTQHAPFGGAGID